MSEQGKHIATKLIMLIMVILLLGGLSYLGFTLRPG